MAETEAQKRARKKYKDKNKIILAEASKKWYLENKQRHADLVYSYRVKNLENSLITNRNSEKKAIAELKDRYLIKLLKNQGFKNDQITPELIELKRITLKTKRLCLQLKS